MKSAQVNSQNTNLTLMYRQNRSERHQFESQNCGYEIHADVNAAINIAQR